MTRYYKSYEIRVSRIETGFGKGIRAVFYVPKMDNTKDDIHVFESYRKGEKLMDVLVMVQEIIG